MSDIPQVGDVIHERYELIEEIGRGGFGVVYRATQLGMDRDVAVKLLRPHAGASSTPEQLRERFRREAMMARNLNHPHTIRQYDFGETEDGTMFLVLEYLEGDTLVEVIRKEGALGDDRIREVSRGVLKSLGEAHAQGIVHRDLKPGNIMLCNVYGETDFVKVLDFGIAKTMMGDTDITQAGVALGSPRYMAPELLRGENPTPASDVYALSITLSEAIIGQPIIPGDLDSVEAARLQLSEDPLPVPDELRRTELWAWLSIGMKKAPTQRWQSAEEMLDHIDDSPEQLAELGGDVLELQKTTMLPSVDVPDDFDAPGDSSTSSDGDSAAPGDAGDDVDNYDPNAPTMMLDSQDALDHIDQKWGDDDAPATSEDDGVRATDSPAESDASATVVLDSARLEAGAAAQRSGQTPAASPPAEDNKADESFSSLATAPYGRVDADDTQPSDAKAPDTVPEQQTPSERHFEGDGGSAAASPPVGHAGAGSEPKLELGSNADSTDATEMVSMADHGALQTDDRARPDLAKSNATTQDLQTTGSTGGHWGPSFSPSPGEETQTDRPSPAPQPGKTSGTSDRKNKMFLLVAIIAVFVVLGMGATALAVYTYVSSQETTEPSPKPEVPDSPPEEAAKPKEPRVDVPPEEPKAPQKKKFFVTSIPDEASVFMNGKSAGKTPVRFRVAESELPLQMTLKKEGYAEEVVLLSGESDTEIEVELDERPGGSEKERENRDDKEKRPSDDDSSDRTPTEKSPKKNVDEDDEKEDKNVVPLFD